MKKSRPSAIVPNLNQRLRQERERLGHTQDDFADLLGINRSTQITYESGKREPCVSYLTSIAHHGVNLQYVLFGDDAEVVFVDAVDWELFSEIWKWVHRVAVDKKGKPYSAELQIKIFRLAYNECLKSKRVNPDNLDLTLLLASAG